MPLTVTSSAGNNVILQNDFVAEDFNSQALEEASQTLKQPYGEGLMSHWYFEGIRMGYSRWQYTDYVETAWKTDLDIIHLHFNLKGKLVMQNKPLDKTLVFNTNEANMFYSNGFEGYIKNEELLSEIFMMQFTREAFTRLTGGAGEWLTPFRKEVAQNKPVLLSDQNIYIDFPMLSAIRDVITCTYKDGLKKMYLQSKCMEIMVLLADAYKRAHEKQRIYCKTEYDRERILFARDYLIQHVDNPPTIPKLARISGINEFKLKKGFHEIFNHTIYGYLADYRLEEAKRILAANQKSATEIAFELGYSSLQHFSSAFKKRYGVSPKAK